METHFTKPTRRTSATTVPPPNPRDEDELLILKPAAWFIKLVAFQAELICNFFSFLSMPSESPHRAQEAKGSTEATLYTPTRGSSRVVHGTGLLLRKLGLGFLGAVYVCLLLIAIMVLAIIVGVGLVQLWVDEPVFVREPLHFDYTEVHPSAIFSFGGVQGKKRRAVPVGHTFFVSLVLLMPESDFNRQIGVFQLTGEVISTNGDILERSSQPCMLRFRSLPIRLTRTFVMGIPLLLGISSETQEISVSLLKHTEGNPRTEAIKMKLKPRAGTLGLPELYAAEMVMTSELPWRKELVRNWKCTFYVWTSFYVYIMMLIILVCCFKPFVLPRAVTTTSAIGRDQNDWSLEAVKDRRSRVGRDREVSDSLRRWQRSRSKRKAMFEHVPETVGSSASSVTFTREDTSEVVEDSSGLADADADAESVYG